MIFGLVFLLSISAVSAGELPLRIILLDLRAWQILKANHIKANTTVPPHVEEAIKNYLLDLRSRD